MVAGSAAVRRPIQWRRLGVSLLIPADRRRLSLRLGPLGIYVHPWEVVRRPRFDPRHAPGLYLGRVHFRWWRGAP